MLINCKECNHQISDQAYQCPHCGFPLKSFPKNTTWGKSRKRKRLPNGFGQITKIPNLRKPYRAMVTVSKDQYGKPICKLLKPNAYFETYNDAYAALLAYNQNPYDLSENITCEELFDRWLREYEKKVKSQAYAAALSHWAYCSELYKMPIRNIRIRHIKGVIEHGVSTSTGRMPTPIVKQKIKNLWNMLFDYAVEYELTDKNYARAFTLKEKMPEKTNHISFTDDEMKILWENSHDEIVSMILIQCYTGWRPQEMCNLELENINLDNNTMIGGMKTEAGEKRIVIVVPAIKELLLWHYNRAKFSNAKYLFLANNPDGSYGHFTYSRYKYRYEKTIKALGLNKDHRPHDPRKQFITMCKRVNMDEYAIKRLVGHTITDLTESTYTDRDLSWLTSEISKLNQIQYFDV